MSYKDEPIGEPILKEQLSSYTLDVFTVPTTFRKENGKVIECP